MAFLPYIEEGGVVLQFHSVAFRSRQDRPYKEPLPYQTFIRQEKDGIQRFNANAGKVYEPWMHNVEAYAKAWHQDNGMILNWHNLNNAVYNKALSKVADKLSYISNLFEAWYERREAYTLLGQCGRSLLNLMRGYKNPSFWKNFLKSTGRKIKQPETLPEMWLLLQFAIKPLVLTIDDCANLLTKEFPTFWVEGASGFDYPLTKWRTEEDTALYFSGTRIVKIGVKVDCLNPNAALANILGLTTPVSTFLNVVPWFWAVNYFVNINDLVSNFETRFPGVQVSKSYTTIFSKNEWFGNVGPGRYYPKVVNGKVVPNTEPFVKLKGTSVWMKRTVGTSVPQYKLERSFPALGSNQFANLFSAIALTMKGKSSS